MKNLKILIFFLLLLVAHAQGMELKNLKFDMRHIGYAEGLSSQRVFSLAEDGEGRMWIATKAGVDRFNGYTVKSYTLPGNFYYGELAGRRIQVLYNASSGLWAYDNTGRIYRYSAPKDDFEQVLFLGDDIQGNVILNKMWIGADGILWFGLNKGLFCKEHDKRLHSVLKDEYVNDVWMWHDMLYVATSSGLWKKERPKAAPVLVVEGLDIQTLYGDAEKKELWYGSLNNGLFILDLQTQACRQVDEQNRNLLNPIRAITPYNEETLLVGIDGRGVYAVDRISQQAYLMFNTEENTASCLRGNGVYTVVKDHEGNIWMGSYTGGVSAAILMKNPIMLLNHERGNPQSLGNDNVNDVEEDSNHNLWFATDSGVSIWNPTARMWYHQLKGVVAVTLCKGSNGIWVGTYGDGIYLLSDQGAVVRHLTKQNGDLTTNYVFSLKTDGDGDLWVGGQDGELLMIPLDKSVKRLTFDVKWIASIESANAEQMAVATVDGFCLVNKHTGEINYYATVDDLGGQNASSYIVCMFFNRDGTVWLGTEGGGLNLYDLHTHQVKKITTDEGLPSNDVSSLAMDNSGRLWVSTGKGIAIVDRFKVSNINYAGDIDKEYNKVAFACLTDGRLAYGSTDGAVILSPAAIAETDYQASLRFTRFRVDDLVPSEEVDLRPQMFQMMQQGEIRLSYRQNSFSLFFESINYRFQRDIVYQYILEGYEKQWSDVSESGSASYVKVSPGHYKLKVRCLRRSNGQVISERELRITIHQPWWNTWWAWLIYVGMLAGIFFLVLRFKSNQLQKGYDEDKIRFFTNTAHDIRTPVTLIKAPLEDLSRVPELGDEGRHLLDIARTNTEKLLRLINQLLDFEKIDMHSRLALSPLSLNDVLQDELVGFQSYIERKQLTLIVDLMDTPCCIMADRHMIEMMLDNLLSNACKYTPQGGKITVSLALEGEKVVIRIQDTGIGIPKKDRKRLFSNVFRSENAVNTKENGTGFGLVQVYRIVKLHQGTITCQSEVNQGSLFTISFNPSSEVLPVTDVLQNVAHEREIITDEMDWNAQDKDTLLIVEDYDALRSYLRQTFERDNRVVDVSSGDEALAYLSEEYPDLILSDVMMPGIQGDELCRRVKENPDTAGIPIILLTAKANHEAMVDGLKKGADDYIAKPFSTEILKLKVKTILDNRRRQREYFMRQAVAQIESKPMDTTASLENEHETVVLSESDQAFVKKVTQQVFEHMTETEFNINALCMEMAMSRTLFYSRLKSLTGKSPQEFIRVLRLQKAAELLKQGMNVTDVADETGFVNAKYFSSVFKKEFGVQPSKYH